MASKSGSGHGGKIDLTNAQRKLQRHIDLATDTALKYAAPEVPAMSNLTPQGLLEDLGNVNVVRKAFETLEKTLKERLKSQLEGKNELRSDNFNMKLEDRPRTALDQTKAKGKLEELGILDDFMATTSVPTMTIKEN
jgi:hypothetical protein